ncbi:MAG: response regulator [Rickettsiales bacterium]|nr:MAG: response regulator [Rickettsiales bacterium]
MQERNIILFVDDEKICHTLVELIIPNFTNYKLVSAFNSKDAISLAERYASSLALVLTDIMLPDLNGYELHDELKSKEKFKDIPFIFQSGLASQEIELKKHVGDNPHILYKPYSQEGLLNIIDEVVKKI